MDYKVVYTKSAERDLQSLDTQHAVRILKKIRTYTMLPDPLMQAKKLKNFSLDTYRFRVGDYRVIFRPAQESAVIVILVILKVVHRKEAYR